MTIDHHSHATGDKSAPKRAPNLPTPNADSASAQPRCTSAHASAPDAQWDSWKPMRDLA